MPELRITRRLAQVVAMVIAPWRGSKPARPVKSPGPGSRRRRPRLAAAGPRAVLAGFAAVVSVAGLAGLQAQPAAAAAHAAPTSKSQAAQVVASQRTFQPPAAAKGSNSGGKVTVGHSAKNDVSPKLRTIKPKPVTKPPRKIIPVLPIIHPNQGKTDPAAAGKTDPAAPGTRAPPVQTKLAAPDMPSPQLNFDGISYPGVNCNCAPPDTNGAPGATQYVQIVNTAFQVFNKATGTSELGPESIETLWNGFGGPCETAGDGDPVLAYDQLANRWVISQFANDAGENYPSWECVAVSTTSDATGSYNRYAFDLGATFGENFYDYPKLGVWPDGYYMSFNIFNASGSAFLGPQPFALDRSAMLAGNPATIISTGMLTSSDNQLQPAYLDGSTPPPAGAPNPYTEIGNNPSAWAVWRFHADFANPANSTFTLAGNLTPDPFTELCPGTPSCVPQAGTSAGLDAIGDRSMFRNAYRVLPNGQEALVGNMTVESNGVAGIRWWQIDNATSGTPGFVQQGTYQPDSTWRWMGSAAMDAQGDLAIGFSASSPSINPQIRYAGRLAGDPPNTLDQGEATLFAGTGSQTGTSNRWGDYSDLTVDPVDDCTFWYTNEYYATTSSFNWRTRIGSFKFPNCTTGPTGTLSGTVTDASTGQPVAGATVDASGYTTTTDASGHYSITLPVGTYSATYSSFGYATSTESNLQITDGATTTVNVALQPAPHETLSGTVTPAAGTAWPLYAKVTWTGANGQGGTTFTSPATGKYALSVLADGSYTLTVTPLEPGYTAPPAQTVTVGTSNVTQDFTAGVDLQACTAIGYHPVLSGGTTEPFTSTTAPTGWRVTNINLHLPGYTNTPGWVFNDPGQRGNHTGSAGNFAIVDSAYDGAHHYQDTQLTSPAVNLSADKTPVVQFATDLEGTNNTTATVSVSVNGGKTWASVWTNSGAAGVPGPATVVVPIPQAAGKAKVKTRFTYTGQNSQWWEIDNVFLGNRACTQQPGGLLIGRVADSSGNAINGATVASVTNPAETATTVATPDDSAINGGLYDLFVTETGSQQYTASATGYTASTQSATVTAGQVSTLNFTMTPG